MTMLNTVKIENTELVRDMETQAVLSTDVSGLRTYQEQRRKILAQRKEFHETKQRLETIEREMATLKKIVGELSVLRSRG
jgi:hypothetical protein